MKTYIIKYNTDGYNSPLPVRTLPIRAKSARDALASALKQIRARRGAIAEAKRHGGRVQIGMASYSINKWAWVSE